MGSYIIQELEDIYYPKEDLFARVVKLKGLSDNYGTARYNVNQYIGKAEVTAVMINMDKTIGLELTIKEKDGKPISSWKVGDILYDD